VPAEVDRWNWGAFLLSGIWLGIHRLWWPLAVVAGLTGLVLVANESVQAAAGVGWLVFIIWLGRKGNAVAWRKHRWESIERFRSIQRRWALGGLAGLVAWIGLVGWGAARLGPPGEFRAHDVAFEYPTSWAQVGAPDALPGLLLSDTPLWIEAVGQDENNGVVVTAHDLGEEIKEPDLIAAQTDIAEEIERSVEADGLALLGPVMFARLGSLPAFQFSATSPNAEHFRLRAIAGYHGHLVYTVVCVSHAEGGGELQTGCDQIISTFRPT
jgi:hypothetical protein